MEQRTCKNCQQSKDVSLFQKNKRCTRYVCQPCGNEALKACRARKKAGLLRLPKVVKVRKLTQVQMRIKAAKEIQAAALAEIQAAEALAISKLPKIGPLWYGKANVLFTNKTAA